MCRETGRSKPEDVVLMVTASYGGEALKVSCWVSEWVSVTVEYERLLSPLWILRSFTWYSLLVASLCYRTSPPVQNSGWIFSNCFECYSELARDYSVDRCYLMLFWITKEDYKHLTIISGWDMKNKKALACRKVCQGVIGAPCTFRE